MAETAGQVGPSLQGQEEASWAQVWHLPVLVLGIGLFLVGLYFAAPEREQNDFPAALDEIAQYLQVKNLDQAERRLENIREHISRASEPQQARMYQYWGDLNYLQLHERAPAAVATEAGRNANRQIIHYYTQAEELGRTLDPRAIRRYAQTLVALGRGSEALAMLDRLEDQPARQRYLIIRDLIDQHRAAGAEGQVDALAPLVERFKQELRQESDPDLRREEEIWVAGVEAQLRLDADAPQQAIDLLLRRIQRLSDRPDSSDLAPLRVLLAKAYQHIGQHQDAERIYRAAQQQIDSADGLNAAIHVGLGQIALTGSDDMNVQRALEHFSRATRNYPSEPVYLDALIGQADCQARLDDHRAALEHFGRAVERLLEDAQPRAPRLRDALTENMRTHVQRASDGDNHELALDYLSLLKSLYRTDLPPTLLADLARTHERIGQEYRDGAERAAEALLNIDASSGSAETEGELMSRDARRLANQQAALHFATAAEYYRRHADAVTITDNEAHGQSLWSAAINFDKAQRWKKAIEVYTEFIQTRKTDPRHLRATHRLGEAFLADGQYQAAADLFLDLMGEHPHTLEAYDSLVPLARSYLGMDEPDKAERTLLRVVTDHEAITPESDQYRDALIELGKLYYRLGEQEPAYYVQAIERLDEAVERYGRTLEGPKLRYLLADSYRRSVKALEARLEQEESPDQRVELQAERQRRLREAQKFYNQVLTELDARPVEALGPLEKLYQRNAYFYQADCAFDRGQYELAIELYDLAAREYKQHPASLVALVQIVNAHCELGQFEEATVANMRARRQLQRIPEEAFEDETALPMSRQHWEDWLRWTSEANLFEGGESLSPQAQTRR
ncbi:MAG: tetratricopeptide repeat protein [Phycisphaeraceae bacterium]